MKKYFPNSIECYELQEKKKLAYYIGKAENLGIKNAKKVVKELINNPRITQILKRMVNKGFTSQGKWLTKKTRSTPIECTERISPMCLKRFIPSPSQSTVCIRCLILKEKPKQ